MMRACDILLRVQLQRQPGLSTGFRVECLHFLTAVATQIVQPHLKLLTALEPSPLVPWISTFSRK
jgi:hypothetical protein